MLILRYLYYVASHCSDADPAQILSLLERKEKKKIKREKGKLCRLRFVLPFHVSGLARHCMAIAPN